LALGFLAEAGSMRVLLTSFEPFGGHAVNSSLEAGRAVAADPPAGIELDWLVLPVVAQRCIEVAWQHISQTRPALVLALGQSAAAATLRVEERAINFDDFPMPDNAGNEIRKKTIVPAGPPVYRATLHPSRVVRGLRGSDIPAEVSGSAGTYVCNHLFYGLLHQAAVTGSAHQTGFLHLPLLPGQVDPKKNQPSWPLERLVEGVRQAIRACVDPEEYAGASASGASAAWAEVGL
jgi:pyroglutamyl-peptidase